MPLALLLGGGLAQAADPDTPHIHQGRLAYYAEAPPVVPLSDPELAQLALGQVVKRQIKLADGGRGVAVQDIQAPPEVVWGRILDFPAYPQMVDNVYECEIYGHSGDQLLVRFIIGALLIRIEYYIDHSLHQDQGWMTWRLDYSRDSDLDDSVGFWRVQPVPGRPGFTRVFYSVEVYPRGWVPGPIEELVTDLGLTKATGWVKRESEARGASGG